MKFWHFAIASCTWLVSSGDALAGVIVVDAAGGGSFTQIQQAINAAVDGDTILVKPGSYAGFSIDGKALTVVGDVGTRPTIFQSVSVVNLAQGQTLTLARLNVGVTIAPFAPGLDVENCDGALRCVESEFRGFNGTTAAGGTGGAQLELARDVAISGCNIVGGAGKSGFTCVFDVVSGGATGAFVVNSSVAIHDSIVAGGHGGDGGDRTGPGGTGVTLIAGSGLSAGSAFLSTSRSNVHGGRGGNTDCPAYGCPNDGGPSLYTLETNALSPAVGWILDSMMAGGPAGVVLGGFAPCSGDPGAQYVGDVPFQFSASGLGFAIPSVAREGQPLTVTFTGVPGSRVFLNDSLATTFEGTPSWRGVLLSPFPARGAPIREIKWGVIPTSGVLTRTYNVPQLPAGEQAQTRFLQAYRVGANGITLGSFRTLTVLDSSL